MRLPVAAVLALTASLGLAPYADAQAGPARLLVRAERLANAGQPEAAVEVVWAALRQLHEQEPGPATSELTATARSLVERLDPLDADRLAVEHDAAARLLDLAQAYARKKYHATAAELCELAERLDPESPASKRREVYERVLARRGGRTKSRDESGSRSEKDGEEQAETGAGRNLIPELRPRLADGLLTKRGSVIVSEPIPAGQVETSRFFLDPELRHEDADLRCDIVFGPGAAVGEAAMTFGVESADRYFIATLSVAEAGQFALVRLFDFDRGREPMMVTRASKNVRVPQPGMVFPLQVLVRGTQVTIGQAGTEQVTQVELPEPPYGGLGVFVNSWNEERRAVEFRALRRLPLPVAEEIGAAGEGPVGVGAAPKEDELARRLSVRVDAAVAATRESGADLEGMREDLYALREDVADLEVSVVRDAMLRVVDEAIDRSDPCREEADAARRAIAEGFVALARRHRDDGRPSLAGTLLRRAAGWWPEPARTELATLAERLARFADAEDAPGTATLFESFLKDLGADTAWAVVGDAVRSRLVTGGSADLLRSIVRHGPRGRVRVEASLLGVDGDPGVEVIGLAIGHTSQSLVLLFLSRAGEESYARLSRWTRSGGWEELDRTPIETPAGVPWYGFEISWSPDDVRARIGQHQELRWRPNGPLDGTISLFVEKLQGGAPSGRGRFRGFEFDPRD
jgi:hypothetical protein